MKLEQAKRISLWESKSQFPWDQEVWDGETDYRRNEGNSGCDINTL